MLPQLQNCAPQIENKSLISVLTKPSFFRRLWRGNRIPTKIFIYALNESLPIHNFNLSLALNISFFKY